MKAQRTIHAGPVRARPRWLAWMLALFAILYWTAPGAQSWPGSPPQQQQQSLQVFVRDDCPHCAAAEAFLEDLARQRPQLAVVLRHVDRDARARDELLAYSRQAGVWPPGVPMFVYQGRILVGFESTERTGPTLLAMLDGADAGRSEVESALFGTVSVARLGLPLFTLALGLLDGLNPCAMWVLLFLLSLLVHLRDRRRMALIAGTFVVVSAAVYYLFMAAWLNVFLAVGLSAAVRWLLAVAALGIGAINVKDFLRPGTGISLSIRPSAKPALFARMRAILRGDTLPASLAGAAALAVVVNFVELLCTAGLPAIYTAVLTQQGLSTAAHYGYLGLYILGYMADDALMVGLAVAALGSTKLSERAGAWLKLVSGLVMLALGAILLLRPAWLL